MYYFLYNLNMNDASTLELSIKIQNTHLQDYMYTDLRLLYQVLYVTLFFIRKWPVEN